MKKIYLRERDLQCHFQEMTYFNLLLNKASKVNKASKAPDNSAIFHVHFSSSSTGIGKNHVLMQILVMN